MDQTFGTPISKVDMDWLEAFDSLPILRMTASEVCGAIERAECLRQLLLKQASGSPETPNEKRLSDAAPKLVKRGDAGGGR